MQEIGESRAEEVGVLRTETEESKLMLRRRKTLRMKQKSRIEGY